MNSHEKGSSTGGPLVSIITVVLNGELHLEQTILSVLGQTYKNIEYIIVDGGSTDGTINIIGKYEQHIDYWISEQDKGIYDAMNKGIAAAKGELIGIINADDYYHDHAVQTVVAEATKHPESQIFHGDMEFQYPYGYKEIWRSKNNFSEYDLYHMPVNHPTVFVRASCYSKCGQFDTRYRTAADFDLILKFFLDCKYGFHYIDSTIAAMRGGGANENFNLENLLQHEKILITRQAPLIAIIMFTARHIWLMIVALLRKSSILSPVFSLIYRIRKMNKS